MKLWTVWVDYLATGEGRTLLARIAYAEDEQAALKGFETRFDEYYASGAEAAQGVVKNGVTAALFPTETIEYVRQIEGRANVDLFGHFHFNFA